jgi:hypothetical protein
MPLHARFFAAVALTTLGLSVFGYGVARAQSGGGAGAPAPTTPDTSAGLQRQVTATPEEMSKRSETHLAQIELISTTVRRQLEKARSDRDVVRTLCLSDKLSQLDVTYRSAKERKSALDGAISRRDTELANHEFQILSVYRTRGERIKTEADSCVGGEVGVPGDTKTTTTIDPGIPQDSTTPPAYVPIVPFTDPAPPLCASCDQ